MRADFLKVVMGEMGRNPDLYFLTGDLGYNVLEPLKEKFPKVKDRHPEPVRI